MIKFEQIIVVKETRENEQRVALTPSIVSKLVNQGYSIWVECDAGLGCGFTNDEYSTSGAKIFLLDSSGFPANSFIVRVLRPSKERGQKENGFFHPNTVMLGFLFPFVADDHISSWQSLGITTLSWDLFKSISIDDPKNAQAAMSRIAGRLALHHALKLYKGNKAVNLTVLGAGAAGISAAKEAVRCNIPVQVLGRKESIRTELEAAKITYRIIPDTTNAVDFIRQHLPESTLVITAARVPGEKAPLLIDEKSLDYLPAQAIIVDLAVSNGGNVAGSKSDQTIITDHGVLIVNISGYPKKEPRIASESYAQCVYNLLTEILSPSGEMSFENPWVEELWVTHKKQRNEALYNRFNKVTDIIK